MRTLAASRRARGRTSRTRREGTRACEAPGRGAEIGANDTDPASRDFEFLYEDDYLYVLDKPSGWLVHSGYGHDETTIVDWVYDVLERKPHPLHRLDRQTSGALLFAKSPQIARSLQEQFHSHRVEKTYAALVRGVPKEHAGFLDHPVPRSEGGARVEAQSEWALVATAPTEPRHLSIMAIRPLTGRFHQIRRHMSHLNHPLINDSNYGATRLNRAIRKRYGLSRMGLHAYSLAFEHPVGGQRLEIVSPWPEDLTQPVRRMGFDCDQIAEFFCGDFPEVQ